MSSKKQDTFSETCAYFEFLKNTSWVDIENRYNDMETVSVNIKMLWMILNDLVSAEGYATDMAKALFAFQEQGDQAELESAFEVASIWLGEY